MSWFTYSRLALRRSLVASSARYFGYYDLC